MARIFISHSSANSAEALALRDWLVSQGWNDLFLDIHPTDGLRAGDRWQAALRASIGRCRAVIFCLSPQWCDSPHCLSEFNEAMHVGAAPVGVIVQPVPLDRVPGEMTKVWQVVDLSHGGTPASFLVAPPPERRPVAVTFPQEELGRLHAGLAALGLVGFDTNSFPWPPPGEPARAPYRGLAPLEAGDAGVFFGRDSDLVRGREAMMGLREKGGRQLLVILGASGAGKSSFLRAGLLPRLQREDRDFFVLPVVRPKSAALNGEDGLVASLAGAFEHLKVLRAPGDLRQALQHDPHALPPLLEELQALAANRMIGEGRPQIDRPPTVVIAIDQAEELFAPEGAAEAEAFLQHIGSGLRRGPETILLATIRSDRFEPLQKAATRLDLPTLEPFNLGPVTPFAFRQAITRPGERCDPAIAVGPRLVDRLIADTAAQGADPLPLLAFSLQRLYLDYGRTTRRLSLPHYEALGGLAGSIDAALREAFAEPARTPVIPADAVEQEHVLEATFIPALADINEANDEPLRRIAAESEIPEAGRNIVTRLIDKRLLVRAVRKRGDGTQEPTIEVAHEALLRQWPTLRRMLDRKSADLKLMQAVERSADAWNRKARDVEWLEHHGDRLASAEALVGQPTFARRMNEASRAYLLACRQADNQARQEERDRLDRERAQIAATQQAQEQTRRSQRRAHVMLYGLLLLALGTFVGALWQTRRAAEREAIVMSSIAQRAITEGRYDRAMRIAVQGLPPMGSPHLLKPWSTALETQLATAAEFSQLKVLFAGHEDGVLSAEFNHDATRVVTASLDKTARIWDAARGTQLLTLKGHEEGVMSAAYSPDGTRVVTSSLDKTARIWDARSGNEIVTCSGHQDQLRAAAFSLDGSRIVTASLDKTARVWDATSGKEMVALNGHKASVFNAAFSPDGLRIVTASSDKTAKIWDAASGAEIITLAGHQDQVWSAVYSHDGKRIVTASYDKTARVWDAVTGAEIAVLKGHEAGVRTAAFSADGTRIVTASRDRTARVWDIARSTELTVLRGHEEIVWSASISPDGLRILTSSGDKTARIWDAGRGVEIAVLRGHASGLRTAAFSPDGRRVLTSSYDKTSRLWDIEAGKDIAVLRGHEDQVRSAAFSADGLRIVSSSYDKTARVWDVASGKQTLTLRGHDGAVLSAAFAPDGTQIVTSSLDKTARVWDARSGKPASVLSGHTEQVRGAAFSPDGRLIVTASLDRSARIWDAATGKQLIELKGHTDQVWSASYSPDGKWIVTASLDKTARLWDAASGTPLKSLKGHEAGVSSAAFSHDGTRIVTTSLDRTARVWDAALGSEITTLRGHGDEVLSAAFSPDGARIVTASLDKTARIWDLGTATLVRGERLREKVCRDKLVGAEAFTAADADDPILSGLARTRPCERYGPLVPAYWRLLLGRWVGGPASIGMAQVPPPAPAHR